MTENVARIVNKNESIHEGFISYLVEQMHRQLADRVLDRILKEGECVCKYTEFRVNEWPKTNEVEFRSGVDIHPLVRCKDCKWYGIYEAKKDGSPDMRHNPSVCLKERYAKHRDPNWFCADGEENKK